MAKQDRIIIGTLAHEAWCPKTRGKSCQCVPVRQPAESAHTRIASGMLQRFGYEIAIFENARQRDENAFGSFSYSWHVEIGHEIERLVRGPNRLKKETEASELLRYEQMAMGAIERHLGDVVNEEATADTLYDEAFRLAHDALIDAGVSAGVARNVARDTAIRIAQP